MNKGTWYNGGNVDSLPSDEKLKRQNLFLLPHLYGPIPYDELINFIGLPIYIKETGEWGIAARIDAIHNQGVNDVCIFRAGKNGVCTAYPASKNIFTLYTFPILRVDSEKLR